MRRSSVPPSTWHQRERGRPTHFVAVRFLSREIRRRIQQVQQWFVAKDPLFEQCLVPLRRLHVALLLTSIPEERAQEARAACAEAAREIRRVLGRRPLHLIASGVGHFGERVLFARVRTEPATALQKAHDVLVRAFVRRGFQVLNEASQMWLSEDEETHFFTGHASFLKVSRALSQAQTSEERRMLSQLRPSELDLGQMGTFFGTQLCSEFELLSMRGMASDGYYPRLLLESFEMDAIEEAEDGCVPFASTEEMQPDVLLEQTANKASRSHRQWPFEDVWPTVAEYLVLRDMLSVACVGSLGLATLESLVCALRVQLFSVGTGKSSAWEGTCRDWDRRACVENEYPVAVNDWDVFLQQSCGTSIMAELSFAEDAQDELFGQGLETLQAAIRTAFPHCFASTMRVEIDAIRNVSMPSGNTLNMLRAAQPRVLGVECITAEEFAEWGKCVSTLTRTEVLVHAWMQGEIGEGCLLARLLKAIPPGIRGLDFQNLDCSLLNFPVAALPPACVAFGTIVLQRGVNGCSMRGNADFAEFARSFPTFPSQVTIVRASFGTERPWRQSSSVIADTLRAKFPGLAVLQIELTLDNSKSISDVPFVELASQLVSQGVRVEVTDIRCKPVSFEYLRAALDVAGAAVHQLEDNDEPPVRPFSHPGYEWVGKQSPEVCSF